MVQVRRPPHLVAMLCLFPLACSNTATAPSTMVVPDPPPISTIDGVRAFPGAVGFGAVAKGGAGGRIIAVTTLADDGPGSFRACVMATGPRVCVFRVNGVIRFTRRPPIIHEPYLTIAGQTAPGDGITLSHAGGIDGRTPLVIKGTHDVIVRQIRVRLDVPGGERGSEDAVTIENSRRVVIDHVSGSGARDENINGFADNDDVTISNSIFAQGVPRHDKCALLASDPNLPEKFSFIGNLCAHNGDRNPDVNFPKGSCVEVINNVFYNAVSQFAEVWESEGGTSVSLAGNSFIAGPDTHSGTVGIENDRLGSTGRAAIYAWDNDFIGNFIHASANAQQAMVAKPSCPLTLRPLAARDAYDRVLANAGTHPRDAFDARIIAEVKTRSGRVGAPLPPLGASKAIAPYPDADGDGMDDRWERTHGTDPGVSDPWGDANRNGIANFDEFLGYRDREIAL